ncbi:MAG: LCP family protein [Armatimonadetes bacterium]|nr:LCP family protein [Armatimonadota bacterium]
MQVTTKRWVIMGLALGCAVTALLISVWPRRVPPPTRGRSVLVPDRIASPGLAPASNGLHEELPRTDRRLVLVMGLDEVQGSHRADTLILVSISPRPPRAALVSIPRDLRVRLAGRGWNKINSAYAYGGPSLTVRAVEDLLRLPIDHYVTVDYESFRRVVDQLGGIQYTVEQRMSHVDRAQGRIINLQPGPQRLDGERALQYVRYRGDGRGDTGRVTRQQLLLRAALAQWRTPATLARLPLLMPTLIGMFRTNLAASEAVHLVGVLRQVSVEEVRVMTVTGVADTIGGVAYVVADLAEVRQSVRAFLLMPPEVLPEGGTAPKPAGAAPGTPAPTPGTPSPAQITPGPPAPPPPPARRGLVP